FNGSSYVDLGNPKSLQTNGSMTWSAWVFVTSSSAKQSQIVARSNGAGWELRTSTDTGVPTFAVAVSSSSNQKAQRYSTAAVALTTGSPVAAVNNAPTKEFHIYANGSLSDGLLTGRVEKSLYLPAVNTTVGRNSAGEYFNGTIDELRIY